MGKKKKARTQANVEKKRGNEAAAVERSRRHDFTLRLNSYGDREDASTPFYEQIANLQQLTEEQRSLKQKNEDLFHQLGLLRGNIVSRLRQPGNEEEIILQRKMQFLINQLKRLVDEINTQIDCYNNLEVKVTQLQLHIEQSAAAYQALCSELPSDELEQMQMVAIKQIAEERHKRISSVDAAVRGGHNSGAAIGFFINKILKGIHTLLDSIHIELNNLHKYEKSMVVLIESFEKSKEPILQKVREEQNVKEREKEERRQQAFLNEQLARAQREKEYYQAFNRRVDRLRSLEESTVVELVTLQQAVSIDTSDKLMDSLKASEEALDAKRIDLARNNTELFQEEYNEQLQQIVADYYMEYQQEQLVIRQQAQSICKRLEEVIDKTIEELQTTCPEFKQFLIRQSSSAINQFIRQRTDVDIGTLNVQQMIERVEHLELVKSEISRYTRNASVRSCLHTPAEEKKQPKPQLFAAARCSSDTLTYEAIKCFSDPCLLGIVESIFDNRKPLTPNDLITLCNLLNQDKKTVANNHTKIFVPCIWTNSKLPVAIVTIPLSHGKNNTSANIDDPNVRSKIKQAFSSMGITPAIIEEALKRSKLVSTADDARKTEKQPHRQRLGFS